MKPLLLIISSFILISCGNVKRVDTAEVKEHMAEYKIRKVSKIDILEAANKLGKSISEKVNGDFNIECVDALTLENQKVELLNLSFLNEESLKNGKIGEILEAYKFSKEQNQALGENLQIVNDTLYFYTFPIKKEALVFKNCEKDLGVIYLSKQQLIKSIK
ncbi:hypothetical protein EGI22_09070 [Lacihabitans sp. LS3-19]|uniref:hypothetical protein n=1 Tax=Lacihabitans sp. LS3-19 TaxID=2487335 RepID=UPI0020CCF4E2|nr:hypothetical protein [Lacihabitans sp. LS3-19]MCP9768063.1 hypothetical protein [Lacihabitans sp. LS3-19]